MPNLLARLYTIGAAALRARQLEMDTTADNLANINTPAFKARRASFQALLAAEGAEPERGGVLLSSTAADFSQGPIEVTGRTWDMAIEGDGFFVVRLPDNTQAYTRLGAFHLDGGQRLVTEQGLPIEPGIIVPNDVTNVAVSNTGVINGTRNGLPVTLGRVQLARFPNPAGLIDQGSGLFVPTGASGGANLTFPGENGAGRILANALENANVNTAQEMISIVRTQRAYGMSARALQITDQLAALTNQLRG